MKVKMIYHTPEYHKLVEAIARVCYQSYGRLSPTSHSMIKGIMNKGHLSVASSGNIVFTINKLDGMEDLSWILDSLLSFKQINNFIRISTPQHKNNSGRHILISMNALTLLDIVENHDQFEEIHPELIGGILDEVAKVPYLNWFIDPSVKVEPSNSPYIGNPTLDNPVILSEDYTSLKSLGFTDYELDIHATITVDLITDRATGLQMWRHGDMTGGCELSQRYCDRSTALVREMEGINEYPAELKTYAELECISTSEAEEHYDAVVQSIRNQYQSTVDFYVDVNDTLKEIGVSGKRAKEIARSVLPNAMTTRIIQCRPLRQWKHFFKLRDTVHAQPEIQADASSLKKVFKNAGIELEVS
ncbi:FAD-dependent thymidylate synthase [Brevibacillus laterosporus]|uniref:FAD-dependent thymidylate synthase n=1 Tax=Brevibacillus laterosporus TaxID=1465 RepID=UPI003D1C87F8